MADVRAWIAALALALLPGVLVAGDSYSDFAEVVSVTPLMETAVPQAPPECRADVAGGARASMEGRGIDSLLSVLRRDLIAAGCAVPRPAATRITGYHVIYRYGDAEYEDVLREDPGSRLRVNVRLLPGS